VLLGWLVLEAVAAHVLVRFGFGSVFLLVRILRFFSLFSSSSSSFTSSTFFEPFCFFQPPFLSVAV
jgi:hypothetical protein